ncbi:MAG: SRPBCC family protein [Pseudomonadota bacterium]
MSEVVATEEFDLSAEALWGLLGDFGDMNKWAGTSAGKCYAEGTGIGALRKIELPDGREIVDRLEEESEFSYTYSIVSSPLPFSYYRATMSVSPLDGGRSRLTWRGVFEAKGLSEQEATAFTENMYAQGIALMRSTIGEQKSAT